MPFLLCLASLGPWPKQWTRPRRERRGLWKGARTGFFDGSAEKFREYGGRHPSLDLEYMTKGPDVRLPLFIGILIISAGQSSRSSPGRAWM